MLCCEILHDLSGKCSHVECTFSTLNSCLLDAEAGLVVRSVKLPLYVNRWSFQECVVLKCMKK